MKKKKIILIGNIINTFHLLKIIIQFINFVDIFVISNKNNKKSDYYNLEPFCKKNKIPFFLTSNIHNVKTIKVIKNFQPDYIFCFGWSQILKKKILSQAKEYAIGYHPAKVPENRGKHPLIWALVLGLKETASTFFQLTSKVDSGAIVDQKKIKISDFDNAKSLYKKMQLTSCFQLKEILKKIIKSKLRLKKIKSKKTNIWRKRNFKDGIIKWGMSAKNIKDLVRALYYPYPLAGCFYGGKHILVKKIRIIKKIIKNAEFGKIIHLNKSKPHVKCGDYIVEIVDYKPKIKFKLNTYFDES